MGGWEEGALQGDISRGKKRMAELGCSAGEMFGIPLRSQDGPAWLLQTPFAACWAGASLPIGLGRLIPPELPRELHAVAGAPCFQFLGGMGKLLLGLNPA